MKHVRPPLAAAPTTTALLGGAATANALTWPTWTPPGSDTNP
jgi:hypothetical protein